MTLEVVLGKTLTGSVSTLFFLLDVLDRGTTITPKVESG